MYHDREKLLAITPQTDVTELKKEIEAELGGQESEASGHG